jgi:hypothetical protein
MDTFDVVACMNDAEKTREKNLGRRRQPRTERNDIAVIIAIIKSRFCFFRMRLMFFLPVRR